MLKRFILPVVIILAAVAVFTALKQSKPVKAVMEKPEKVWRVNTLEVIFQDISPEVTVYGRVETPRQTSLTAAMVADVVDVNVLEGEEVAAGQILVQLDDTDLTLLISQRKADLAEINAQISSELTRFKRDKSLLNHETELLQLADNAVSRAKKLEKTRVASQAFLDDALATKQRQMLTIKRLRHEISDHPARMAALKAKEQRADALLELARIELDRTQIKAPFSGRVAQLDVAVGDRLMMGNRLLSVYDLQNLEIRAQIPSRHLKQIRGIMSQGKQLIAEAIFDNQSFQCTLDRLSGEVRVDSGGIDGLFRLSGNSLSLALGSFVELDLKLTTQKNVVALPFNVLYGLDHVYVLKDGYLQSVKIELVGDFTTDSGEKRLLIRSPQLRQGDQIVSTQLPNAITGLRVEALSD